MLNLPTLISFDHIDYVDMINLKDNNILHEPSFTTNFSYDYFQDYLDYGDENKIHDPKSPCHTQGTKRFVQPCSNVSKRVDNS